MWVLRREGAANALRINDKLLLPDGFSKAEEMLSKKYKIIKVKVDEIAKVDAGLSCMSLRWWRNKSNSWCRVS